MKSKVSSPKTEKEKNKIAFSPGHRFGISREQIARRAYELWLERGCPAGRDLEIWLEAERQLKAKAAGTAGQLPSWDNDGLAAEVEKRLDELTDQPPVRSPTSLEL